MTFEELMVAMPKLMPLLPRLEKAASTFERVMNDPDVKDAIAVTEEAAAILKSSKS